MKDIIGLFETKVKDVSIEDLHTIIKDRISLLISDFGGEMDELEGISNRVCDLLYGSYRNLIIGQIARVFEDISLGIVPLRKISVVNIMSAFQQWKQTEFDKSKSDMYKHEEPTFAGNFISETGLPMGLALIYKADLLVNKVITPAEWDTPEYNLTAIARKIKNGVIKVHIKERSSKNNNDDMPEY